MHQTLQCRMWHPRRVILPPTPFALAVSSIVTVARGEKAIHGRMVPATLVAPWPEPDAIAPSAMRAAAMQAPGCFPEPSGGLQPQTRCSMAAAVMTQAVLVEAAEGMLPAEQLEAVAGVEAKATQREQVRNQQSAEQSVGYTNAQALQVPSTAARQEAQKLEGLQSGGPGNAALQGGVVPSVASSRADADQIVLTGQSQTELAGAAVQLSIAATAMALPNRHSLMAVPKAALVEILAAAEVARTHGAAAQAVELVAARC